MNDLIVASTNIFRHPIETIKTLGHMIRISRLLKKDGYKAPLRKDIWTMNVFAGFFIIVMTDSKRYTYNTRTKSILD